MSKPLDPSRRSFEYGNLLIINPFSVILFARNVMERDARRGATVLRGAGGDCCYSWFLDDSFMPRSTLFCMPSFLICCFPSTSQQAEASELLMWLSHDF